MLASRGASIDYDTARSLRSLLKAHDVELLGNVPKEPSSPAVLCKVLPEAMAIRSKPERRQAMSLLLTKGVLGPELSVAPQKAVDEAPEARDHSLIDILIQHQASVDLMDANGNYVHMAARQGDLRIIQQLCSGPGRGISWNTRKILSSAAPLAFYTVVLQITRLLLYNGTLRTPVTDTLVQAVCQDHDHLIVALLLDNGADVNHLHGKATKKALKARNAVVLKILCDKGRFERQPLEKLVLEALNPVTARLLVIRCAEYPEILSSALFGESERLAMRHRSINRGVRLCGAQYVQSTRLF